MVLTDHNPTTTPCPECGKPMPMVTWIGAKPLCQGCARKRRMNRRTVYEEGEQDCLHERLERSKPPNQRGGPHGLVCPCPKCSITC